MPAQRPRPDAPRRRRLAPDDRRQEILEAARRLFAQRPYRTVTTAEIADAAGVARSLVHHYFGGIRDVFLAVAADGAAALSAARTAGAEVPFEERTARNLAASLDVIADNRETWLAIAGHAPDPTDTDIHALLLASKEHAVQRTLQANADLLRDTPQARFALRCFNEFTIEATRLWLLGERSREEVEALLLSTGRRLIRDVIPSLPALGDAGVER
ncbi:TetR/AcrR family transcriptional regulator [Baekduia soli]|uniref:TetR/AcrR family transcriptional regulator n=1 Tax=Baekduia soli TaxID=496014 RepID=UPI00165259CA|nr:TetR/AcrR family transcriptional regulator [Baekduia soli]